MFGAFHYTGFMSEYKFSTFLRYNSMFGLIPLGMCFVIITDGMDLSVGSVVALASVVAALLSAFHLFSERGRPDNLPSDARMSVVQNIRRGKSFSEHSAPKHTH